MTYAPLPGAEAAELRLRQHATDTTVLLAEQDRLRARVAELEEIVRLLRVQLPLMKFAVGPDPAGPDPRWSGIPEQRRPSEDRVRR